jgi:threonine dehydrogenase-like Zn-dependent dehydrogenase
MRIEPGTRVAILGDGRLGLLVAQVLGHAQAQVTLIGRHAWKLDLARSWGAKVHGAGEEEVPPGSFPVVVDASGSPQGLEEALRLVEPRGTVVMKSTFHSSPRLDATKLVVDEITLLGSRCGDFSIALDLLRRGHASVEHLVSKVFPLEEGVTAFEYVARTSCLKVLLATKGEMAV